MMDVEIIDDFLDQRYIDFIEQWSYVSAKWEYRPDISSYHLLDFTKSPWRHGLSSTIHEPNRNYYFESSNTSFMIPFVLKVEETFGLKMNSCYRARFDMTLISPENSIHDPHQDFTYPHYACILYVNDSDGDTVIYNETQFCEQFTEKQRISPKKNRLVLFNGLYFHTGHSPSKHQNRILVNSNYNVSG